MENARILLKINVILVTKINVTSKIGYRGIAYYFNIIFFLTLLVYILDTMFIQRSLTDSVINKNQTWVNVLFVLSDFCILTCSLF